MTGYFALVGILIAAPVGLFLAHAIVSRLVRLCGYRSVPPQTIALGTIAAGNIPLAWLAWEVHIKNLGGDPVERVCGFAYALLTYNACCFCYLNLLNMTEISLHVNIL